MQEVPFQRPKIHLFSVETCPGPPIIVTSQIKLILVILAAPLHVIDFY